MEKNSYTFSFKKIPAAFIIAVVIFFVVQACVFNSEAFWKMCGYYSRAGENDWIMYESQMRTMPKKGKEKRVFFVGSSQVRQGIDTDAVNKSLENSGTKVINLGLNGAVEPWVMYAIMDKIIQQGPDTVVYIPYVGSFYEYTRYSIMHYVLNMDVLREMVKYIGMGKIFSHRKFIFSCSIGEIIPFFRYALSLREIFARVIKNRTGIERWPGHVHYYYFEDKTETYFESEIEKLKGEKYSYDTNWKLNRECFKLFASMIIASGIKFVVLDGPTNPIIKKTYESQIDVDYKLFFRDQASQMGFSYISSSSLPAFNEDDFIDFTHLNSRGRRKYSEFLGEYLQK